MDEKAVIGYKKGSVTKENIIDKYNKDLLDRVEVKRKFKIVVDASNGTAGKFIPTLLRKAGCEVIEQNCEIDSSFPLGAPDPTEESVSERLSARVLQEKADLGFSYDADGDRMGVVDDKGTILWNDILVSVFAEDILSKNSGAKIVYNALCSKIVEETILKNGGVPVMWKTGHSFIKAKTKEVGAPFGGELSGHFFFLDNFYGHDDGGYATLRLLEYLSKKNDLPSEIFAKFNKYISSPEIKIGCPDDKKVAFVAKITQIVKKDFSDQKISNIDGARVDFKDAMMVARYSQNGPYLTFKFEALTQQKYDELKKYIDGLLKNSPEIDWSYGVNVEALK
jgi:phosphomannomutase/phosphoglucomutase